MTTNVLRDLKAIIADIIEKNVDLVYPNGPHVADLILKRIEETHFILERGPTIDHSTTSAEVMSSWAGQVDRQGGSFSDQEIADRNTWR